MTSLNDGERDVQEGDAYCRRGEVEVEMKEGADGRVLRHQAGSKGSNSFLWGRRE